MGHPIVMGRKTYDSIGRALPGRTNIVVTRRPDFHGEGLVVCRSLAAALDAAGRSPGGGQSFVIGGGEIYAQTLPLADRLYLTLVDAAPECADTFFPPYDAFTVLVEREPHPDANPPFTFATLARATRPLAAGGA
jgi:dihydrofolate reductase